jgi:hypothetical protein
VGEQVQLHLLVQELLEAEACNEAHPRFPALVQQRLLRTVVVVVGVRSLLGTDLLQIALEVDWHPLTDARS